MFKRSSAAKESGATFQKFEAAFEPDAHHGERRPPLMDAWLQSVRGYAPFAERFAGCSFDGGLYRIHDAQTGPAAARMLREAFPEFASDAVPFAFDWMGNHFALEPQRLVRQEPGVMLLGPGTGEALEIPSDFVAFHEKELIKRRDAALYESFFAEWRATAPAGAPLAFEACVGYKVPLFLGGSDTVENLEAIDWEVYGTVCGRLRLGLAELSPGTSIRDVAGAGG